MIYLDNAATTFPKPHAVADEVSRCMLECGGNPGRGAHPAAMAAAERVYECREALAELFGAPGADKVIMMPNATYGLNLAIKGLVTPGASAVRGQRMHVIISDLEHNSVLRPIERLRRDGHIDYSVFPSGAAHGGNKPHETVGAVARLINRRTRAVICTAASNICSVRLPLAEIGELCRARGILFIVDAAQGAGHFPIDMKKCCIDALALPGHKGLYGPGGSGALILGERYLPTPIIEGGSGAMSFDAEMPPDPPERYEAGTLNVPACAGLIAGIDFVRRVGIAEIGRREEVLFDRAAARLGSIRGVRIYAPQARGPVISFNVGDIPSDSVANSLGRDGICVRGGFHCAPLAHRALGSTERGSVRVSFGYFNTPDDVDALAAEVALIAKQ